MQASPSVSSVVAPAGRHFALLIDADNISRAKLAGILAELSKYGTPNIRRAYGDWTSDQLRNWKAELHEFAIRPMQQFSYSSGKNATDISLVIDAMDLLYTQRLDAFAIASSDADFTPLVMHLRAAGHEVYGFGERKTPEPFVAACTTFLYLDTLVDSEPETKKLDHTKAGGDTIPKGANVESPKIPSVKELAQNTQLITALRGGVKASAGDNGWALLSAAGSAVKRLSSIEPRNYGRKSFTSLYQDTGLFELQRLDKGQFYVADKRNRDRTPKPVD